MKALIIEKPASITTAPLKMIEREIPKPSANQVLLKISKCGICHTDLHVVEGDLPPVKYPVIPGHQIVGQVLEIGDAVHNLKKSDRAGVAWLHRSCGTCRYCLKNMENLCDAPLFTGYSVDGGFAEYAIADADFTYKLPDGFSDLAAAPLLCAGIIGYRSFKLCRIKEGETLGLYGFGASAHIVLQIANYYNCKVFVFTRSEKHRTLAIELGAAWAGSSEEKPPVELASAIIFAPVGALYINALKALRKGGTVASAGIHMSPVPQFPYELLYHERIMLSVANSTREDARELLHHAVLIPIKTTVEVFPLSEANNALQLLKQGKINGAAVLEIE
ncbi:MAG: alcohol dehydrogenase [Candidatus Fischerbacteria bacterium RBG_13_37_8]|uniref:alcohol dehydrogenase n=1 Tax=Candidatus Fischerbacteria bacterium RBG_13_37_8 TaxID=1817863 RepID=A0A1F5VNA6_9BACT|nr:MAG: alcohol dehydrogenase [Candidatus Fischerbacteria bacterium RBG_13_37_8]